MMKKIIILALLTISINVFAQISSRQKINSHLFSKFIEKVENNFLKKLRVEKKSKKRLEIEKEMKVIKLAERSKSIWNSLSLKDQEKVKNDFKSKMDKKNNGDLKSGKMIAKLFDVEVKEKQAVYSINILVGLMRNVQNNNTYNHSLVSQLRLRDHEYFRKNEGLLKKFEVYIQRNLIQSHQQEVIDMFKKSKSKKDKADLQNRVISLFKDSIKS